MELYFPESVNDAVMDTNPYNSRGARTTRNSTDGIFSSQTVLDVTETSAGLTASLVIGVFA